MTPSNKNNAVENYIERMELNLFPNQFAAHIRETLPALLLQVLEEAIPPEKEYDPLRFFDRDGGLKDIGFNDCRNQILSTLKEMKV